MSDVTVSIWSIIYYKQNKLQLFRLLFGFLALWDGNTLFAWMSIVMSVDLERSLAQAQRPGPKVGPTLQILQDRISFLLIWSFFSILNFWNVIFVLDSMHITSFYVSLIIWTIRLLDVGSIKKARDELRLNYFGLCRPLDEYFFSSLARKSRQGGLTAS